MLARKISRLIFAGALVAGVSTTWADEKADLEEALAAAKAAQEQANSVGGEWRDTGKIIKKAEKAGAEGDFATAVKLANKAKRQGELGYEQAIGRKDADMPSYMTGEVETREIAAVSAENRITPDIASVEVQHAGEKIVVMRGHDKDATVPEEFLKTDRGCPPFCVQPMNAADGVETIGEVEVLEYLQRAADGETSILLVDSRTPDWAMRGTIPGSVNIPWNQVSQDSMGGMFGDAEESQRDEIFATRFGAEKSNGSWDFSDAKTLVLFCNGIWCPQSSANIQTLVKLGYPAEKLKWYRGGMQDWVSVGLTTVKP